MLRSVLATSAAVLMATSAAACGGNDEPKANDSTAPAATGSETAGASATPTFTPTPFDPPKKFEKAGFPVGLVGKTPGDGLHGQTIAERAALVKNVAVVVDNGRLLGADVSTGLPLWQLQAVPPEQASAIEVTYNSAPVAVTIGGRDLVLVSFNETVKGTGTTKDHSEVSLQAVDPADGKVAWHAEIDFTPLKAQGFNDDRVWRLVADDQAGLVVLAMAGGGTVVVDLNTQKIVSALVSTDFVALGKGILAVQPHGANPTHGVVGMDPRTKQVRWRALPWAKPITDIRALGGAGSVIVAATEAYIQSPNSSSYTEPKTRHVIDLATGKTLATFKGADKSDSGEPTCQYDGTSVLVCGYAGIEAFAVDTTTGRKLWWFDNTGGRMPPTITAAFHGVVYGRGKNTPVMLDAKTGQDLGDPGAVAMALDEYGTASYETDGADDVVLHRAIG
jgi:outer membrane protein assembly factor BamB